jgi:glycosyltransferase involved in cell wall biosynthesis
MLVHSNATEPAMPPAVDRHLQLARLSVLMPVYNEFATIQEIVRRVLAAPINLQLELIAVDDGSTDGSAELLGELAARDERIRLFRHERNRGKGAAIRTALAQATGDVVLIQDADLEYDPADYPALLAPILAGQAEAVYGSRFLDREGRIGFAQRVANRLLTRLSNRLTGLKLTDMETGYKAIRTDTLRGLILKSDSFAIEGELTYWLAQRAARIQETPIRYQPRTVAAGKKIRIADFFGALVGLLRLRFAKDQDERTVAK